MNKYFVEFVSTLFLVLFIGMTGNPIAIAGGLTALIYAGGYLSGAHYNPAVTVALWLRKKLVRGLLLPYLVAEFFGAILGALLVNFLKGTTQTAMVLDPSKALLVEFLGTFVLAYVILHVATAKQVAKNEYYGLAIGLTVLGIAFAFGSISGGAFNPAVAVALVVMNIIELKDIWIHIVGDLLGAVAAVYSFKFCNSDAD